MLPSDSSASEAMFGGATALLIGTATSQGTRPTRTGSMHSKIEETHKRNQSGSSGSLRVQPPVVVALEECLVVAPLREPHRPATLHNNFCGLRRVLQQRHGLSDVLRKRHGLWIHAPFPLQFRLPPRWHDFNHLH